MNKKEPRCGDCVYIRTLKMWPKYKEERKCCVAADVEQGPSVIYEVTEEDKCEACFSKTEWEDNGI